MAKGETRYQSAGRPVTRFDNTPIPVDDYPLELQKDGLMVKKSKDKGPDAIPFVACWFRAQGTNSGKPGAKDRIVFHNFFTSMVPGTDGVIMPERGGGIVEFCRANGEEADFSLKEMKLTTGETVTYMDPEEMLAYLQDKVGVATQGHVIIEKGKDAAGKRIEKDPGQNKVGHWNLSEDQMTGTAAAEEEVKTVVKGKGAALPKKK